jgi:hypothetical protein
VPEASSQPLGPREALAAVLRGDSPDVAPAGRPASRRSGQALPVAEVVAPARAAEERESAGPAAALAAAFQAPPGQVASGRSPAAPADRQEAAVSGLAALAQAVSGTAAGQRPAKAAVSSGDRKVAVGRGHGARIAPRRRSHTGAVVASIGVAVVIIGVVIGLVLAFGRPKPPPEGPPPPPPSNAGSPGELFPNVPSR